MAWQWIEFLHSVVDPSYVPPIYSAPIPTNATKQDLKRLSKEADEYNKNTQEIAKNTETVLVTGAQVTAAAVAIPSGPLGMVMAAEAVEGLTDTGLKVQGQAPTRSLRKTFSPVTGDYGSGANAALEGFSYIGADIRGDKHYYNGGSPVDHPYIAEHQKKMTEITRQAFAKHGLNPDGTLINRNGNDAVVMQGQNGIAQGSDNNTQTQDNNSNGSNGKPSFLSSIGSTFGTIGTSIIDFFKYVLNSIINLFKHSEPQLQNAAANTVTQNARGASAIPTPRTPTQVQAIERGM